MPLGGAGCELGWCEPVEARVWPVGVVVDPPCFDDLAYLDEVGEQGFVQAFVSKLAVEALDEAILHRLARRDVMPFDAALLLPGQDGIRRELGAVVADDHARATSALDDAAELADDAGSGQRGVGYQPQALPGEVIDNSEDAEAPPACQRVHDEVERPAQIAILRDGHRGPGAQSPLAAAAFAHG